MAGTASISWGNATIAVDTDVQTFLTASGITDYTQITALNNLVIAAKANGWWTKCIAIYPIIGGTASTHKWNLKDPQDLDASFRLTFPNGATHNSGGIYWNGTNQHGRTFITWANLAINDIHISYYTRENKQNLNAGGEIQMDVYVGTSFVNMRAKNSVDGTQATAAMGNDTNDHSYTGSILGLNLANKSSNTSRIVYVNGVSVNNNVSADGGNTSNTTGVITLGVGSLNQCAFATIGTSLTPTQVANMYTDIQAYQTILNRQV